MKISKLNVMEKSVFGALLALTVSACGGKSQSTGTEGQSLNSLDLKDSSGIVNGSQVSKVDQLSQSTVALYLDHPRFPNTGTVANFCTGTLIATDLVLTAAHCVVDMSAELQIPQDEMMTHVHIGFGTAVVENIKDQAVLFRNVKTYRVHEKYVKDSVQFADTMPMYDVALIRLSERAPASATPVQLLKDSSALKVGQELTLVGFGLTSTEPVVEATQMMKVGVNIDNPNLNGTQFTYLVRDSHSACSGDSGGPAYLISKNGQVVVAGVTSWGDKMCQHQGAYTSVPAMYSWIQTAQL